MVLAAPTSAWRIARVASTSEFDGRLQIDQVVVRIGEERMSFVSAGPLCRRVGRRDELRHGLAGRAPCGLVQSVGVPSRTARRLARLRQSVCSALETDLCLLASAAIRLASTANPSPPTNPSSIHRLTTVSKTYRNASLSRNRPCRFFEKVASAAPSAGHPEPRSPGRCTSSPQRRLTDAGRAPTSSIRIVRSDRRRGRPAVMAVKRSRMPP